MKTIIDPAITRHAFKQPTPTPAPSQEPTVTVPWKIAVLVSRALGKAQSFMTGFEDGDGENDGLMTQSDLDLVRTAESAFDNLLPLGGLDARTDEELTSESKVKVISLRSSPAWLNALSIRKENDSVASIIDASGQQIGVVCLNALYQDSGVFDHIAQAVAAHTIED